MNVPEYRRFRLRTVALHGFSHEAIEIAFGRNSWALPEFGRLNRSHCRVGQALVTEQTKHGAADQHAAEYAYRAGRDQPTVIIACLFIKWIEIVFVRGMGNWVLGNGRLVHAATATGRCTGS